MPQRGGGARMHLVDTTLFYSPTSGGVRRYLNAKHGWYARQRAWQHSLLVPGDDTALRPAKSAPLPGLIVPGTFNYRLPLRRGAGQRCSDALRAGPDRSRRCLPSGLVRAGGGRAPPHPGGRLLPFASAAPGRHALRRRVGRLAGRYLRWLYERFDLVSHPAASCATTCARSALPRCTLQPLGVDTEIFHPARAARRLRGQLGLRRDAPAGLRRPLLRPKRTSPVLHDAFARLGPDYHLLLIGGGEHAAARRQHHRHALSARQRRAGQRAGLGRCAGARRHRRDFRPRRAGSHGLRPAGGRRARRRSRRTGG